jgi:uncharacterized membrane protein
VSWVGRKAAEAKQAIQKAKEEIEEKTADKLMEEEVKPTLREHHGVPQGEPKEKK